MDNKFAKKDEISLSNLNLLINHDFKINQRGSMRYVATNTHINSYDGWMLYAGWQAEHLTTSGNEEFVSAACIQSGVNARILAQFVENYQSLRGKIVTFSVHIITGSSIFQIALNDGVNQKVVNVSTGLNSVSIQVSNNATQLACIIGSNGNETVVVGRAKLEVGYYRTEYIGPDPATELHKCRERYQTFAGILTPYMKSTETWQFSVPTPYASDGTPFTASFADSSKFNIVQGIILYDISGNNLNAIPCKFGMAYDNNTRNYYINAVPSTGSSSVGHGDVFLAIGPNCPIEFTHE